MAHGVAILPDHQDLVRVIQGQHGHRTRVDHHVPFGQLVAGKRTLSVRTVTIRLRSSSADETTGQ